jgi:DnaJ-domain-containing protein 1
VGELARRSTTSAKAEKRAPAKKTPAKKTPAKKAAAHKAPGKKSPGHKATAKQAGKKASGKKAAPKKVPPKKVPPHEADTHRPQKKAKKAAGKKGTSKRSADPPPSRTTSGHRARSTRSQEPTMGLPQLAAPPKDALAVLGLKEPLHPAELRRAWRVFAARHHPDRGGDAVTFARGQNAYDELQRRLSSDD